jgi:hypothetical protein
MIWSRIMLRRSKVYLRVNGTTGESHPALDTMGCPGSIWSQSMKTFLLAAVAAVSLGVTGAAMASPIVAHTAHAQQAQNSVVLPSPRPAYLARNSNVLPNQRPAYLAGNSVVLPSQRPSYLA